MEDRVKERLTGAAILVTLVVLLVPELFRGERSDTVVAHSAPDGAPPLRSYTIELGAAPQAAAAAATVETPAAAPAGSFAGHPASHADSGFASRAGFGGTARGHQ